LQDLFVQIPSRLEKLKESDLFSIPSGVVTTMKNRDQIVGFMEVRLQPSEERLFNRRTLDFLKVVAGQVISFVENRRLVEEKNRSDKMAVVGRMVSIIVHDIKNPLSGISGYAQLIKRRAVDEKIKGFVDIMLEELARLEEMNNELLAFVRGDQLALQMTEVNIDEFIDKICQIISPDFESNQIKLEVNQGCTGQLKIDINRMKRVFVNIASNARDAMPEGGRFSIGTKLSSKNQKIEFELRDTGTGMPPEVKARLFEPFFTSGKKNGTGLGMAITKNIVEKHGGEIRVESEQGNGTAFIVSLPLA
jgi:signal transduction histidine kinase